MISGHRINGLIVPLLLPMDNDSSIDFFGLKTLVARLSNKGVKNFFVFPPYSEKISFSDSSYEEVLSFLKKNLSQKATLLVGCFGGTPDEIVESVHKMSKFSQTAVVNLPLTALESEVFFMDFFEELFNQTKSDVVIYNNPFLFRRNVPVAGINKIAGWERLLGIIDSSHNRDYFNVLCRYKQSMFIAQESEELLFESLSAGCNAFAPLTANVFPTYFLELLAPSRSFSVQEQIHFQSRLNSIFKDFFPPGKKIQACKYLLSLERIIKEYHSIELEPLTGEERAKLDEFAKKATV